MNKLSGSFLSLAYQNLLPDPAEGMKPCWHVDFIPVRVILDFGLLKLQDNQFVLS